MISVVIGMARKPEYRNPRVITAILEGETKDEIDQFRGRLSYGKVITLLWKLHKGEIKEALENENLRLQLEEKDRRIEELEKLVERLQRENEKLRLIKQVLEEDNKQLKAELSELRKQLKMSARERRAEDFKQEIHEVIRRYGKDGSIKMLELLKRLGYSSDFKKHAREILEEWFIDEGKILVSEELGLVVEKDPHYGEPAWVVRLADSFRFSGEMMEVEA